MGADGISNDELSITRDVNKKYYRNFLGAADCNTDILVSKEDSEKLGGVEHAEQYINPYAKQADDSICRGRYLFCPKGSIRIFWDFIIGLTVLFSVLEIPFRIAFIYGPNANLSSIDILIIALFSVDILTTLNTAYYEHNDKEVLITDRRAILCHYATFWLWIDLLSTIPFSAIVQASSTSTNSVKLAKLLKLFRLAKLYHLVQSTALRDLLESFHISHSFISASLLLLEVLVIAHVVGCFWFYLATFDVTGVHQPPEGSIPNFIVRTWVTEYGYEYSDIMTQYIISLYWSFMTLFGIGYGNIHPTSTGERTYAMVTMIIGTFVSTAVILSMRDVIEMHNLLAKELRSGILEFDTYLVAKNVPSELKEEAKSAYLFYLTRRPSIYESGLLDKLPPRSLLNVINHVHNRDIELIKAFSMCDSSFMSRLIVRCKPHYAKAGDIIYGVGDVANELSFVSTGAVRITIPRRKRRATVRFDKDESRIDLMRLAENREYESTENNGNIRETVLIGYVSSGNYFGDFEYDNSRPRIGNYEATENTSMSSIDFKTLKTLIDENHESGNAMKKDIQKRFEKIQIVMNSIFLNSRNYAKNRRKNEKNREKKFVQENKKSKFCDIECSRNERSRVLRNDRHNMVEINNGDDKDEESGYYRSSDITRNNNINRNRNNNNSNYNNYNSTNNDNTNNKNHTSNHTNTITTTNLTAHPPSHTTSHTTTPIPNVWYCLSSSCRETAPSQIWVNGTLTKYDKNEKKGVKKGLRRVEGRDGRDIIADSGNWESSGRERENSCCDDNININTDRLKDSNHNFININGNINRFSSNDISPIIRISPNISNITLIIPPAPDRITLKMNRLSNRTIALFQEPSSRFAFREGSSTEEHSNKYYYSLWLIHPNDRKKLLWNFIIDISVLFSVTTIPLEVAYTSFLDENTRETFTILNFVIDVIFLIDIFVNFRTVYYSKSKDGYIINPYLIAYNYLTLWFILDFLSCIPIITKILSSVSLTYFDSDAFIAIQLIKFAKLFRVFNSSNWVHGVFPMMGHRYHFIISQKSFRIGTMLLQVIFVGHIVCCVWWGLCSVMNEQTWYDDIDQVFDPLRDASFVDQYVASFYWTITTLSTTGYGDIVPIGNNELILCIVIMIVSATVFGYIIASIFFLTTSNRLEKQADIQIEKLAEYLKDKECPTKTLLQATEYLRRKLFKKDDCFNEELLLSRLPLRIRMQILLFQNRHILNVLPIFRYVKNPSRKLYILGVMKVRMTDVNERIAEQGHLGSDSFFLFSGRAAVWKKKEKEPSSREHSSKEHSLDGDSSKEHSTLSIVKPPSFNSLCSITSDPCISPLSFVSSLSNTENYVSHSIKMEKRKVLKEKKGKEARTKEKEKIYSIKYETLGKSGNTGGKKSMIRAILNQSRRSDYDDSSSGTYSKDEDRDNDNIKSDINDNVNGNNNWTNNLNNDNNNNKNNNSNDVNNENNDKNKNKNDNNYNNNNNNNNGTDKITLSIRPQTRPRSNTREIDEYYIEREMKDGDYFGTETVLKPSKFTVIGLEPCIWYSFHRQDMSVLALEQPDISCELQSALALVDRDNATLGIGTPLKKKSNTTLDLVRKLKIKKRERDGAKKSKRKIMRRSSSFLTARST